jgi:hypothetical protein
MRDETKNAKPYAARGPLRPAGTADLYGVPIATV